jgi:hypothetical protein
MRPGFVTSTRTASVQVQAYALEQPEATRRITQVLVDPTPIINFRRQDLLHEADHERLLAQVPAAPSAVRRELALVCLRLADWLETAERGPQREDQDLSPAEPGPAHWVAGVTTR